MGLLSSLINHDDNGTALRLLERIAVALERLAGPIPVPTERYKRGPEALVRYSGVKQWTREQIKTEVSKTGLPPEQMDELLEEALERAEERGELRSEEM